MNTSMTRLRAPSAALALIMAAGMASAQSNEPFPAAFELSSLVPVNGGNGSNGFVLNGNAIEDFCGRSVSSAGDVNGDGIDDLIIGAAYADPNGNDFAGTSYVVFGGAGVGSTGVIELASLNGSNGFILNGINEREKSGYSVSSAGDMNGDGIDDLLIGAPTGAPNGVNTAGESYVVFGGVGVGSTGVIELASLNGSNGFEVYGVIHDNGNLDGGSGNSVSSAGDVNGDGFADIIIGSKYAGTKEGLSFGQSHIVFGGATVGSTGVVELGSLDGSDGFSLDGINLFDQSGHSVSSAGDVNGDGFDDFIIGSRYADPNEEGNLNDNTGESYVVFGGLTVGSTGVIELASLNGTNGFVLNGVDPHDMSSGSVSSAGDVNGDGFSDIIIGAAFAESNDSYNSSGDSYVVFGGVGMGSTGVIELDSLNGTNGFVLNGIDASDFSGVAVASAGDVNGDGIDDLIIGAIGGDPNGSIKFGNAGESYVVYGAVGLGSTGAFSLASLDGTNGFTLNGIDSSTSLFRPGDHSGYSVSSAGDMNDDGIDDLIIGALRADPNGNADAGECYVVFGRDLSAGCLADLTSDGLLDFFDVSAFLDAFGMDDPIADFTNDGLFDFFDVSAFLDAFGAGCP